MHPVEFLGSRKAWTSMLSEILSSAVRKVEGNCKVWKINDTARLSGCGSSLFTRYNRREGVRPGSSSWSQS